MAKLTSTIIPDADTPLWQLGEALAALGGVRGQSFEPVQGTPRWGYAVTAELYRKWQESQGVDPAKAHDDQAGPAEGEQADARSTQPAAGEPEQTAGDGTTAAQQGDGGQAAGETQGTDDESPAEGEDKTTEDKTTAQRTRRGASGTTRKG